MADTPRVKLPGLIWKTIVAHTLTYFLMGVLAFKFLNYAEQFARPDLASYMRQVTDPLVMAGPLFQPIRGIIFALVFFPFREILFGRRHGWFLIWWLLVGIGILSTFGPASGSVEGMIYTLTPIRHQLSGWLEVMPQALLLSLILWYWVRHPEKRWLTWTLSAIFVILFLLVGLGLLVTKTGNA